MSSGSQSSFLVGVLGSPKGKLITAAGEYRRYRSSILSSTTIGGNKDTRVSAVFYEVGRVYNRSSQALRMFDPTSMHTEVSYPTPSILAEDFVGLSKKYSNFSATFNYTSLAGIVERLGKGLAAASVYGNIGSTDLRGGRSLVLNALGTDDGLVNSMVNTVFIPRRVDDILNPNVFSVLVNAVSGEGSCMATDVVELDAATRQPIVPAVGYDDFPRAAIDALRILGANMIAAGQGPLFAYALTRGIHNVVTVVGHTDEGGVMRDILRNHGFSSPFGGIHYGLAEYTGLPTLASNKEVDWCAYVDAIALSTAALVAHCDPGQWYNSMWFPTICVGSSSGPEVRPGNHTPGTVEDATKNLGGLCLNFSQFAVAYIGGLGKLFGAVGSTDIAATHLTGCAQGLQRDNRHLQHASVSPYFWIEPTSIIPRDFLGSVAESEGAASYGTRDTVVENKAFEDIEGVGESDTTRSAYNIKMRFARSSWFLAHWNGHPQNGLGCIEVRQADPNAIIHPGDHAGYPELRDRVEAGVSLAGYLWKRGQSPFPAPGELLNLTGTYGIIVKHLNIDGDGIPTVEHVPTAREFLSCSIAMHIGRPTGIHMGP